MNALNWLLRGVVGFFLAVGLTLIYEVAEAEQRMYVDEKLGLVLDETPETSTMRACNAKMAEAMKEIDPFVERGRHTYVDDLIVRTPQQELQKETDRLNRRDAALRRRNAVMKDCVR